MGFSKCTYANIHENLPYLCRDTPPFYSGSSAENVTKEEGPQTLPKPRNFIVCMKSGAINNA